jgi:hypothetical protein
MAYIPVPEVAHCKLIFNDAGEQCINDLYFSLGATPTAAQLSTLAADLGAWWRNGPANDLSDECTLVQVLATDLGSQFGAQGSFSSGWPGQITSEQVPNNVSPCISFRTGFRGRSFRGRNYLVGLPSQSVLVNTLDSAWMATMVGYYQQLIDHTAGITESAWDWVVVSRFLDGGPRVTGIFTFVSTVLFTDNIVDSQRRRLPGRGS